MSERREKLGSDPWPRSPICGEIVLDWPRRYEVEALGSERRVGAPHHGFPHGDPQQAARFGIHPMGADPWIGSFAYGRMMKFLSSTVTNGPQEDWVTVVAAGNAYLINAFDPKLWLEVEVDPVMDVRACTDLGLVVFADFCELTAYGVDGVKWRTERLAYDGLRIDRIDRAGVCGVGWNAPTDRLLPFIIDPETGLGSSDAYP